MPLKPILDFEFPVAIEKGKLVSRNKGEYLIRIQISEDGRFWFNKKPILFGEALEEEQ